MEIRTRVVACVDEGNTHRATAAHFRVFIKFVNDMVTLKREAGCLDPKPQGCHGHGKLAGVKDWVRARMSVRPDTTLDALRLVLLHEHGIEGHRSSVGGLLRRLGLSHKKDLRASEQKRPDVARERTIWRTRRQTFMRDHLERPIFIDETALKTNMTKTPGWAPYGERLMDHAPAGRWNTQTFVAGLRHDRIAATGVINGPMDKDMFISTSKGSWPQR